MKKVDLSAPILDADGSVYKETHQTGNKAVEKTFSLRDKIRQSLLLGLQDDTPDVKLKKFDLAMEMATDPVELSAEDIVLIKDTVGKVQNPLVFGRIMKHIDPPSKK